MIAATLLSPEGARIAIPVALVVGYACYHWWRWRMKHPKVRADELSKPTAPGIVPSPEPERETETTRDEPSVAATASGAGEDAPSTPAAGEEDYRLARSMVHQEIPDYSVDRLYLDLLCKSAKKGYAPAAAKLAEYAMRRGCNVEAYYWLWLAKRGGMPNLERTMRQVRIAWAIGGYHRESVNEYAGFTHKQGTVGYALLCIDARHNADAARARLAECAPGLLG